MASVDIAPQSSAFLRPDGKEKVTGSGRYTADLTLTGQTYARFRYTDHPHARILRVDTSKARALSGVLAVLTHEDVPDVKYGQMAQDRHLFAKDVVRFEADIIAGVAATTEEIAAAGRRADRGRVRAAPTDHRLRGRDGRGRAARARGLVFARARREPRGRRATLSGTRRS